MRRHAIDPQSPDTYINILSRAISSSFNNRCESNIENEINNDVITTNKKEMLNIIESSTKSTDRQLTGVNEIKEWLNSLNRDQLLFQNISDETSFSVDSPYSVINRLIENERNKDEDKSDKKRISVVEEVDKDNLRIASYTQSANALVKNLFIMQKEIHEIMKPENILKSESSSTFRLENLKEKLTIEFNGRKETNKLLTKELKRTNKLFNEAIEYHKKLEEDEKKLEIFLKTFQSKSSIEIIEKAKKNKFIEMNWIENQKKLNFKIREIYIEINKYKNRGEASMELSSRIYANNLEFEKKRKYYEDIISLTKQDLKISDFIKMSSLQILEKEMMNSLNFHRGTESKNTQTKIKMQSTSFSKLLMKYSKDKQTIFNKFEKILRKNNVTFETALNGLTTYKTENKNILNDSFNQLLNDMNTIIENYKLVFRDKYDTELQKINSKSKHKLDILISQKQRLSSMILSRESDIDMNLSTFNKMESVYVDILHAFSLNDKNDDIYTGIKNEIHDLTNFISKASIIFGELTKRMQTTIKTQKEKNTSSRRSSSVIQQHKVLTLKTDEKNIVSNIEDDKIPVIKDDKIPVIKNDKIPVIKDDKIPVIKDDKIPVIKDDNFALNETVKELNINTQPIPPKIEEKATCSSPRNKNKVNKEKTTISDTKENDQTIPCRSTSDQKVLCNFPSVPPDLFNIKKKNHQLKNVIKDNSPHFSERKPRSPRREKSRIEIEEARKASIMSHERQSKKVINYISKVPFVKNTDPKIINEIDSVYSYSNCENPDKKKTQKIKKAKSDFEPKQIDKKSESSHTKNSNDEFYCIKNNINISKSNISELPFSKRETSIKHQSSQYYPYLISSNTERTNQKNTIKNHKSSHTNPSAKIFNFSEMTLNNYSFEHKKNYLLGKTDFFRIVDKLINEDQRKTLSCPRSTPSIKHDQLKYQAELDYQNRRNNIMFSVKSSKNNIKQHFT